MIELEIVPYLLETKHRFKPKVPHHEIINAILYKLKTEVLPFWQLSVKEIDVYIQECHSINFSFNLFKSLLFLS